VGTLVVRIQRVRLADSTPSSFDETYLPREIGEKIIENDLEAEPIFSLLEQKYNTPLVEAEYRLEAVCGTLRSICRVDFRLRAGPRFRCA
jgi:GntR family transcriptional regulator